MKTKHSLSVYVFLIVSFVLSSCMGLPALNNEEETINIPLGPQFSLQEHQTVIFETFWSLIKENYVYYENADVEWEALRQSYTKRINSGLTPEEFSSLLHELETDLPENEFIFQSRSERIESELADTSVTYGGIGAFVGFQEDDIPHIVILDVMPDSPAEDAGLRAHDSILAIDGESVHVGEGVGAVNRIRGMAGTTTMLTVQTPGEKDREVELTRVQVTTTKSALKVEEFENADVGYVLFPPSVYSGMTDEFLLALSDFSADRQELKGLILDLRISNATTGWPLESMLTLFQDGRIGEIYNRSSSQVLRLDGQDLLGSQNMPLVILVGENTGGLPEIFAAAMQSSNRATVIGSNTSGNIETLAGYFLPDGSHVFIASTSFRFLDGEEVGINGIRPQVKIEARWDQIIPSEDPVIQAATELLEVE